MDGNFKLVNMETKRASDDVWLRDGEGFVVKDDRYQKHIGVSVETTQVS